MALSPGKVKDPLYGRVVAPVNGSFPTDYDKCGDPAILCCTENGCGQAHVQWWLLILAGLSIPIILCCKPCILWRMAKAKQAEKEKRDSLVNRFEMGQRTMEVKGHDELDDVDSHADGGHSGGGGHGGHGEDIGDLMIHQTIETIEFVLGFVSNT